MPPLSPRETHARGPAAFAACLLVPSLALTIIAVTMLGQAYAQGRPAQGRPGWYRYEILDRTVQVPSLKLKMKMNVPVRTAPATGEPAPRGTAAGPDVEVEMVSLKGLASALGGAVRAGPESGAYDLLLGTEVVRFSPRTPGAVRIRGSVIPLSREAESIGGDIYLPIDFMQRVVTPILRAAAAPRAGPIPASAVVSAVQVPASAKVGAVQVQVGSQMQPPPPTSPGSTVRPGGAATSDSGSHSARVALPLGGAVPAVLAAPALPAAQSSAMSAQAAGFVVVLDPGHGGAEMGALGRTGAQEKEITLDVAKRLKALIEKTLGVTVLLTRSEDGVVALDDRTALANQNHADMFLSIHVNAAPRRDAHGAETYFLSYKSKDEDIRTLAAIENNAAGVDRERMGEVPESLDLVLWDLAQAHYLEESSRLAETIQMRLNEALGVKNRGVKQAPFRVLMGATMPAVLVEIGFISNPSEETSLKSGEYRDRIAQALARAIAAFLPDAKRRVVGSLGSSPGRDR